jgi:hypothetical protein
MNDIVAKSHAAMNSALTSDVARFRSWRRGEALSGFECLDTEPRRAALRYINRADKILAGGWRCGAFLVGTLAPPVPWDEVPRSISFHLHSWDPFATFLMAHSGSGDPKYLKHCLAITLDWLDRCARTDDAATALTMREGFAWYDMAVGMRSYRLGYLLDALAREEWADDATVDRLLRSLLQHLEVLSDEGFLAANSNHGFYQAWGQLAATWRYRAADRVRPFYDQAMLRLRQMLRQQFFDEGIHREHSPGYQLATLSTTLNGFRSGIVEDAQSSDLIRAAEAALAWFFLPNGNIAAFGDTDPWVLSPQKAGDSGFEDPHTRWALSAGLDGSPLPRTFTAFPESGWFVVRSPASDTALVTEHSYLAQFAGFHSRTHKHADHGGFIWYDRGQEILVDTGRYFYSQRTEPGSEAYAAGFWYGDPKRMYAESTRAHNCIEIDQRDYPRKGVKFFGSALTNSGAADGLYWSECTFLHFRTIRHARFLVLRPGHFLLIYDWLACKANQPHRFEQWLHFAPSFDLDMGLDGATARATDRESALAVTVLPLLPGCSFAEPQRGCETPRIQGWMSDKANSIVPNWAMSVCTEGTTASLATLVVLSSEARADRASNTISPSGRSGRLIWHDDSGAHRLNFSRPTEGTTTVRFDRAPLQRKEGLEK